MIEMYMEKKDEVKEVKEEVGLIVGILEVEGGVVVVTVGGRGVNKNSRRRRTGRVNIKEFFNKW